MEDQQDNPIQESKDINYLIALYYTSGDEKCAREMVEGKYRDVYVIKAFFESSSLEGAFLLFYNIKKFKLIDLVVFVTSSPQSLNLDLTEQWWEFERNLVKIIQNTEQDSLLVRRLKDGIIRSFTKSYVADLNKFLETEDEISMNRLIQKTVLDALGLQRIVMKAVAENITSLEMELKSITTQKIDINDLGNLKQKTVEPADTAYEQKTETKNVPKVGVDGVKLILKGSFILSPIKGKDIMKLQVGDRVRINIIDKNPKAVAIAKAFNAYDEQNQKFLPVDVRIRQIEKVEGKGIEAYALLAKGILVHLVEEEENIKVAMDPNYVWQSEEKEKEPINVVGVIIILLVVGLAVGVAMALIKLL